MPYIIYNGDYPQIQVHGFGHFKPGDRKFVDYSTAVQFTQPEYREQGWTVEFEQTPDEAIEPSSEAETADSDD